MGRLQITQSISLCVTHPDQSIPLNSHIPLNPSKKKTKISQNIFFHHDTHLLRQAPLHPVSSSSTKTKFICHPLLGLLGISVGRTSNVSALFFHLFASALFSVNWRFNFSHICLLCNFVSSRASSVPYHHCLQVQN